MKQGQALVVVLLVMAVAATIGLSVASRSTSQVSVSTTQDESSRALEAAEAGVEQALGGLVTPAVPKTGGISGLNASFYTTQNTISGSKRFLWPVQMENGDAMNVSLDSTFTANSIWVCWGNHNTTEDPMVEVTLYYDNGGIIQANRTGYDPRSIPRFGFTNTNVQATGCAGWPQMMEYKVSVDLSTLMGTGTPVAMRIRMLGNTTPQYMAVDAGTNTLPVQANDILSTGSSGATTQKIHVKQTVPDYQNIFDSALFSGAASGITK